MSENLLVLTTAGRLKWLQGAVETFQKTLKDPLAISWSLLVVDDATPNEIGIRDFCRERNIAFITKEKPRGLVHSWNLAYQYFMKNGYKYCILSNDDVRFPRRFSKGILTGLRKFDVVGPVSNDPGVSKGQKTGKFTTMQAKVENIDKVQHDISHKYHKADRFEKVGAVNGFCFAFSRSAKKFEFKEDLLFNPKYANYEGEFDFCGRVHKRHGTAAICKVSYVYHYKRGTYRELGKLKTRQQLWR